MTPLWAFENGKALNDIDAPCPKNAMRWVHLDLTDQSHLDWIEATLPATVADHLQQAETRPRCDAFEDGYLINLRGVNLNEGSQVDDMVSLRIWAHKDLVVTARLRSIKAAQTLHDTVAATGTPNTTSGLLTALALDLTTRINDTIAALEDAVDESEEALFDGHAVTSHVISTLRKRMIKLRRFVAPQRAALLALSNSGLIDAPDQTVLRETINQATHNVEAIDANRDRLTVLQDHLDTQHDSKLGRNSYILSVAAAIFLPLGFVTGLFGVNVAGMPGTTAASAFAILSAGCIALGLILFVVFRLKRWL